MQPRLNSEENHNFKCLCYLKRMTMNKTGIHFNKFGEKE